uniref:Uncharacterized LOC110969135 n=1 Tax=Acanthochromis polyacanthus TaxID=80966 RepID=A0A3Q1FEX4_9TELE
MPGVATDRDSYAGSPRRSTFTEKRGTSVIWLHFGFKRSDMEQKTAVCKLCYKTVPAPNANTTNLFCHLKKVRFVCIVTLGVVHVLCTLLLIQRPNMMAFRVGGALESLQEQYFLLNLCFSMVTFDLQAQLCLCILITTTDSAMSTTNTIVLIVGVVWACLTAAVGAVAVLKEAKVLVGIFMMQNLPQVAFFIYLMYTVIEKWFHDNIYTLEAAAVTGAAISLMIKVVLFWGLIRLVHSFGQGLRERMFASS